MSDTNSNQIDPQQMVDQLVQTGQVGGGMPITSMGSSSAVSQAPQDLPLPSVPPAFTTPSFTPPSMGAPMPPVSLNLNQTLPTQTPEEPIMPPMVSPMSMPAVEPAMPTSIAESPVLSPPPATVAETPAEPSAEASVATPDPVPVSSTPVVLPSYVDNYAPPAGTTPVAEVTTEPEVTSDSSSHTSEAAPLSDSGFAGLPNPSLSDAPTTSSPTLADPVAPPADEQVAEATPPAIIEHQLPAVPEEEPAPTEKPVAMDSVVTSSPSFSVPSDTEAAPSSDTTATPPSSSDPAQKSEVTQALEDQNIFHLLGIQEATDAEKEEFLDELQQIIWEDFVENDVELLLTQEELAEFKKISDKSELSEEDRQTEMIEFLEKLIPDLEKIMLEKALELKEEMMRERINELLSLYSEKPEVLTKINHARDLIDNQQWRTAADELNLIED